ncbi:hypothetical protein GCM10023183_30840 [Nibribacter koreensis]|uniref:Uncharacterized protein n=1 Tax=Nibribacter koreensis TaxID=1084519 RepID=A0ABP8FVK6_9BACT
MPGGYAARPVFFRLPAWKPGPSGYLCTPNNKGAPPKGRREKPKKNLAPGVASLGKFPTFALPSKKGLRRKGGWGRGKKNPHGAWKVKRVSYLCTPF